MIVDVSEVAVSTMLAVMFILGMVTQALLVKGDVWTNLRAWWLRAR